MKTNDSAILINKIICFVQILIGAAASIFFGVPMIFSIGDKSVPPEVFLMIVVLTALSLWVLFCGIKRQKMAREINKYINVIGNVPNMKFEEISTMVQESEYEIEKNVAWMIKKNFFTDAYINHEEKSIVFKSAYEKVIQKKEQEELAKKQQEYVSVVCPCCNGTTKIVKGKDGTCDYCGAPIVK